MNSEIEKVPKGWAWTSVGEIAYSINPGFPSGRHNKENRGIPHLRPMNINAKGEIDLTDLKYVEPEDYDALIKGDVLFNNTNSPKLLGKTAYIKLDTNWAYSNHMTRIRISDFLLNPAWVSSCLHTLFLSGYFSMHCVHHVNQASVSSSFLSEKVFIPLPPLPEQHRIVAKIEELFTRLDAGVEALKKIKAQLKRYRQAVLKHAFEGKLTAEWRQAHQHELESASVLLERICEERRKTTKGKYKELPPLDTSGLPELPEGWAWTRVGDISEAIQYGYTASSTSEPAGPRMLRITDIQNSSVDWDIVPYCRIAAEEKSKYLLKDGDLVFARTGATVGKSFLIRDTIPESVFASYLIRIALFRHINKAYVYSFFQSHDYWMQIYERQLGIGQPNVNSQTLSRISVPLPPILEQHRIVEEIERRFSIADEIEKIVDHNLKQAERLRRSILKRAFEGKLVPQDPNDEPAEKLLERIREQRVKQIAEKRATASRVK